MIIAYTIDIQEKPPDQTGTAASDHASGTDGQFQELTDDDDLPFE